MPPRLGRIIPLDPNASTAREAGDEPVLRTRFVPPRPRPQIVQRPRVDALMARALEYPLTIVKAEAGYGKTTAVVAWLAYAAHPHAWYSVGDPETDPRTFVRHLVHALDSLVPGVGAQALERLEHDTRSPRFWHNIVDTISNDLLDRMKEDTVLVLDDYDSVNVAEVNAVTDRLVETMPPRLHVVITARTMPSLRSRARWRASGELLEVTRGDLAFTAEEVVTLFAGRQTQPLSIDAARAIVAETEGWPIALQMLSEGLRDPDALDTLLRRIPGPSELLFDYLADEVFLRQPSDVRRFLGETASLRRLDPSVCDYILETTDSSEVLRSLERQSLFVTRDTHFRYHHLFGDFLLRRSGVPPERRRHLHTRAAAYYIEVGEVEEAVHHLLAAGDYAGASSALSGIADAMAETGRHHALGAWLDQLPDAVLAARPELLYARAETWRLAGRYADALPAYDRAIARFRAAGDTHGEIRALRGQALVYLDTVQPARADPLLRAARRAARGDPSERVALYLLLAENTLNAGDVARAARMYRAAERAGGTVPTARLYVRQGRFADVRAVVETQRRVEPAPALRPRAPRSHREPAALLSWIEAMTGEGDLARHHAEESLEVAHTLGSPAVECIARARLGLGWLCGHEHDAARARAHCLDAIRVAERMGVARFEVEPLLGLTLVDGFEGNWEEAIRFARRALAICDDAGDRWVRNIIVLAAGAALALAEQAEARAWLQEAIDGAITCGDQFIPCVGALWLAIHHSRSSRQPEAREAFAQALDVARREGYGFVFQGTALLAPRDPALWRGLLRRAQEHPAVGGYARQVAHQFESTGDASLSSGTESPATAPLYIQTLGAFRVWRRGQEVERTSWGREKAVQVLQYLVCHRGHAVHREQIIEALWHDAPAGAAATGLRVALSALRDAISPERATGAESPFVKREGDTLRLAGDAGVRVDADDFARLLKAARSAEGADAEHAIGVYESALALYRGEFLSEQRYAAWAEAERQQRRAEFLVSAERQAVLLLAAGELDRAARWGTTLLQHDPLWEGAYAVLMEAHWRQGNRALAVRVFRRCQKRLQSALGVSPGPRMMALLSQVSQSAPG
jgi:ATP/maltotriose-dependent transcriptional regulator MalT